MAKFISLNPGTWFGAWGMLLAGTNVSIHTANRWAYWEWSSISLSLILSLAVTAWWVTKYPFQKINSLIHALYIVGKGFILFLLGTVPSGFNFNIFILSVPYIVFFLVAHLTWSISSDIKNKVVKDKKAAVPILSLIVALSIFSGILGYLNDDPIIGTISATYTPFPIVALLFPLAIRHFQRSEMYVIAIPLLFLCVRMPWFLFLIFPLLWFLRHYNFFVNGYSSPSFKVDSLNKDVP